MCLYEKKHPGKVRSHYSIGGIPVCRDNFYHINTYFIFIPVNRDNFVHSCMSLHWKSKQSHVIKEFVPFCRDKNFPYKQNKKYIPVNRGPRLAGIKPGQFFSYKQPLNKLEHVFLAKRGVLIFNKYFLEKCHLFWKQKKSGISWQNRTPFHRTHPLTASVL